MYVCVRVCVYSILDIFPQPFGFLFQHFKDRINERKAKACFLAFPSAKGFRGAASKSAVISRFRSLTVQRYSIKKRKTPYVGGTRRGYGLI